MLVLLEDPLAGCPYSGSFSVGVGGVRRRRAAGGLPGPTLQRSHESLAGDSALSVQISKTDRRRRVIDLLPLVDCPDAIVREGVLRDARRSRRCLEAARRHAANEMDGRHSNGLTAQLVGHTPRNTARRKLSSCVDLSRGLRSNRGFTNTLISVSMHPKTPHRD